VSKWFHYGFPQWFQDGLGGSIWFQYSIKSYFFITFRQHCPKLNFVFCDCNKKIFQTVDMPVKSTNLDGNDAGIGALDGRIAGIVFLIIYEKSPFLKSEKAIQTAFGNVAESDYMNRRWQRCHLRSITETGFHPTNPACADVSAFIVLFEVAPDKKHKTA